MLTPLFLYPTTTYDKLFQVKEVAPTCKLIVIYVKSSLQRDCWNISGLFIVLPVLFNSILVFDHLSPIFKSVNFFLCQFKCHIPVTSIVCPV